MNYLSVAKGRGGGGGRGGGEEVSFKATDP